MGKGEVRLLRGDVLRSLAKLEDDSVKATITSPPYHGKMERYGGKGKMTAKEWASWMADVVQECCRVSTGEVIVVANGQVRKSTYSPSCERLIVECDDRGIRVERPVIWFKNATTNRRDWFSNTWEYCMAFGTKNGFNWESVASPPKYKSGGAYHQRDSKGKRKKGNDYPQNKLAQPRDVFKVTVGGGHLGSKLAHENEAPYPEKLVLPFVLTLTDPGDTVLDPFGGSGTTLAVALMHGRKVIGIDNRSSQIQLMRDRVKEARQRIKDGNIVQTNGAICSGSLSGGADGS